MQIPSTREHWGVSAWNTLKCDLYLFDLWVGIGCKIRKCEIAHGFYCQEKRDREKQKIKPEREIERRRVLKI